LRTGNQGHCCELETFHRVESVGKRSLFGFVNPTTVHRWRQRVSFEKRLLRAVCAFCVRFLTQYLFENRKPGALLRA
jgi:hypothetical protein